MKLAANAAAGEAVLKVNALLCELQKFFEVWLQQQPISIVLWVNPGKANFEKVIVNGFGSVLLESPLQFDHNAGEPVVLPPTPPSHPPPPTQPPLLPPPLTPLPPSPPLLSPWPSLPDTSSRVRGSGDDDDDTQMWIIIIVVVLLVCPLGCVLYACIRVGPNKIGLWFRYHSCHSTSSIPFFYIPKERRDVWRRELFGEGPKAILRSSAGSGRSRQDTEEGVAAVSASAVTLEDK